MKVCPNCKTDHNKSGIYCSRSCANIARGPRSQETKDKIRAAVLANPSGVAKTKVGGSNIKGIKRAKRLFVQCKTCGVGFETLASDPRRFCSAPCVRRGGQRNGSGRAKTGYYKGIYCGSTYELAFLIWNLDHGENISRCDRSFTYEYHGETRIYWPDFKIDDKIYEIKGRLQEVDHLKISSCSAILIDQLKIKPYIEYVSKKYNCHKHKLWTLYDSNNLINCQFCGNQFAPPRKTAMFCSRACSARTNRLKAKWYKT